MALSSVVCIYSRFSVSVSHKQRVSVVVFTSHTRARARAHTHTQITVVPDTTPSKSENKQTYCPYLQGRTDISYGWRQQRPLKR